MSIPTCQHQFADRTSCDCPAISGEHYCRWHRTEVDRQRRRIRVTCGERRHPLIVTLSRHPNVIQHNIQQVIDAIVRGRISDSRARTLLYAIATTAYS